MCWVREEGNRQILMRVCGRVFTDLAEVGILMRLSSPGFTELTDGRILMRLSTP